MTTFTRKNAWNNNGTFDNTDLLWYAKAVAVMQSRSLDDPTSWWFFAAIHGQYVTNDTNSGTPPPPDFPNWADIPAQPNVPTSPLPASDAQKLYWDQCQHGTWFFPPWHRGYLYAIENILREIIVGLKGPGDWALPYWDYFGQGGQNLQYFIPPAFTLQHLPDNSVNPLFVTARYGPDGNGKIFIPIPPVSQACQVDTKDYTGTRPDYYGGGTTGFENSFNLTGALEGNPHNPVHTRVGGNSISSPYSGLMSDPGTAALDPVFYLHHCNIDRMWAAWNKAGNNNPPDMDWLKGPIARADRKFAMPKPDKTVWDFIPEMVDSISQLNYTYEDLTLGTAASLVSKNVKRMRTLANVKNIPEMSSDSQPELIGANSIPLTLNDTGARTNVALDTKGWKTVSRSLKNVSEKLSADTSSDVTIPDEVYLQLEGIKGTADANSYTVSVNHQYAGDISLFGLRKASMKDSHHGGAGLTVRLDITSIVDQLHLEDNIDINSLDVLIQPSGPTAKNGEVTVDRVSIYRKGQK